MCPQLVNIYLGLLSTITFNKIILDIAPTIRCLPNVAMIETTLLGCSSFVVAAAALFPPNPNLLTNTYLVILQRIGTRETSLNILVSRSVPIVVVGNISLMLVGSAHSCGRSNP